MQMQKVDEKTTVKQYAPIKSNEKSVFYFVLECNFIETNIEANSHTHFRQGQKWAM